MHPRDRTPRRNLRRPDLPHPLPRHGCYRADSALRGAGRYRTYLSVLQLEWYGLGRWECTCRPTLVCPLAICAEVGNGSVAYVRRPEQRSFARRPTQHGASRVGVRQQFCAYRPFMSPATLRRYDQHVAGTVSSRPGRDRQQPLLHCRQPN